MGQKGQPRREAVPPRHARIDGIEQRPRRPWPLGDERDDLGVAQGAVMGEGAGLGRSVGDGAAMGRQVDGLRQIDELGERGQ